MGTAVHPLFEFETTFVDDLTGLYEPWAPSPVAHPELIALNEALARDLGLVPTALRSSAGVEMLAGNTVPDGSTPVAQAYAGHQFGGYSPRLGDGRALLLGEIIDTGGSRRDIHLKGSGRTPFARGGDGRAALGPMLREYLMGEAMHALGIPTTRALAVVTTGEQIVRDQLLPGAVLTRVASSHLRVGTFQYAAAQPDPHLVRRLADHAIARHYPSAEHAPNRYVALLGEVVGAQASLVADWMLVGFIHGVMNTDNMTISGETIDYGPCAFMDAFDPATVYSSIDHGGRYAYGNQPQIALWDLARLAESLLSLVDDDTDAAVDEVTGVLESFNPRFRDHWNAGMRAKLGLATPLPGDDDLFRELADVLRGGGVDFTSFFRVIASSLRGHQIDIDAEGLDAWLDRWHRRLEAEDAEPIAVANAIDLINPIYIPRNHLVEEALSAASADGDLAPFTELLGAVTDPYVERARLERYAHPAPPEFETSYRTFCGT